MYGHREQALSRGMTIDRVASTLADHVPPSVSKTVISATMCNITMLGEFEYLLLTATARLGEKAYGAAIDRKSVV